MLAHCYPCNNSEHYTIRFDGKDMLAFQVSEDKAQHGSTTTAVKIHFDDTKPHAFEVTYAHRARLFGAGLSLQWTAAVEPLRAQALDIVKKADVVVAFVGLSPNLEGEEMPVHIPGFSGGDRTDITLPAAQQQLLEAAKATGKPLVVVLMNGSALAVNWAQQNADAILEAWYPGEAGAQAIAETLAGINNPAGRLPVTFYAWLDQLPPFDDYAMANRTYRYFKGKPLYGFGYGLSYTSFAYSNLKLSTNTSPRRATPSRSKPTSRTPASAQEKKSPNSTSHHRTPTYRPIRRSTASPASNSPPARPNISPSRLDPRTLSQVDDKGVRAVTPGSYSITVGSGQPHGQPHNAKPQPFTIEGTHEIPR